MRFFTLLSSAIFLKPPESKKTRIAAFYVPQQVTAQVYRITEEKEENVEKRHSKQFNISGLKKIVIFLLMDIVELHSSYKFRVEDEGKTKG